MAEPSIVVVSNDADGERRVVAADGEGKVTGVVASDGAGNKLTVITKDHGAGNASDSKQVVSAARVEREVKIEDTGRSFSLFDCYAARVSYIYNCLESTTLGAELLHLTTSEWGRNFFGKFSSTHRCASILTMPCLVLYHLFAMLYFFGVTGRWLLLLYLFPCFFVRMALFFYDCVTYFCIARRLWVAWAVGFVFKQNGLPGANKFYKISYGQKLELLQSDLTQHSLYACLETSTQMNIMLYSDGWQKRYLESCSIWMSVPSAVFWVAAVAIIPPSPLPFNPNCSRCQPDNLIEFLYMPISCYLITFCFIQVGMAVRACLRWIWEGLKEECSCLGVSEKEKESLVKLIREAAGSKNKAPRLHEYRPSRFYLFLNPCCLYTMS